MNGKERILAALRRETPDRVPVMEWFIDKKVSKTLVGTDDPVDQVELLDLDAVNLRADYTKEWTDENNYVDEWGTARQLTGDAIAASLSHPISNVAEQADYQFPEPDAPGRFATLQRAVEKYGDTRAVIFNLRDGFSDMRDLLGYQDALMAMALEPVAFKDLLKRAIDYQLALAKIAAERYGIQVVATTDDVCTANGPFLSMAMYEDVLLPAFNEVIAGYKSLGMYVIKHCDGDVRPLLQHWVDAGIDCLDPIDPGAGMDLAEMKKDWGDKIALKGNVDCTGNLCDGTPEQVREEVRECLAKGGPDAYILSSSNTIHQGVLAENFKAMLDEARK